MGTTPITAMSIVAFPRETIPMSVLEEILAGGLEKVHEAGALLLGGHTIDDTELKYGLSVTGIVRLDRVMTNTCRHGYPERPSDFRGAPCFAFTGRCQKTYRRPS